MKKVLPVLCLLLLHVSMYTAQAQSVSEQPSKAQQEVLKVEQTRFEAMQKNDQPTLHKLVADDLIYVHSSAKVENKEQFLNSIRVGTMVYESIQTESLRVRTYDSAAIITGLATIKAITDGQPIDIRVQFTDVYAKRKGAWQLVSWQSTRLPATK